MDLTNAGVDQTEMSEVGRIIRGRKWSALQFIGSKLRALRQ